MSRGCVAKEAGVCWSPALFVHEVGKRVVMRHERKGWSRGLDTLEYCPGELNSVCCKSVGDSQRVTGGHKLCVRLSGCPVGNIWGQICRTAEHSRLQLKLFGAVL